MATFPLDTPVAASQRLAVRQLEVGDLTAALREGYEDFAQMPSHLIFLCLIYPVFGIVLAALTFSANAVALLFPLVSGFALIGPFAAIGLYELSRRREEKLDISPRHALAVFESPARNSVLALGIVLLVVLGAWLLSAMLIYQALYGGRIPDSYAGFLWEVLTTSRGWALIVLGHAVGLLFALAVFSITVISFPLILDRKVGLGAAILTSIELVRRNPRTMAIWAAMIAGCLIIGSAPLLVGLALVLPILGHASWHLYRRAIAA
jgi:uncharacterized membrane protein